MIGFEFNIYLTLPPKLIEVIEKKSMRIEENCSSFGAFGALNVPAA